MKPIRDYLADNVSGLTRSGAAELIDALWGGGYTIVRRQNDPLNIDKRIIPRGMAYQWCAAADVGFYKSRHWGAVPSARHDGLFAPAGYVGDIESGGLVLMEKPKSEVDAAHAETAAKAQGQVEEWTRRVGADGFSGTLRSVTQSDGHTGDETVTPIGEREPSNIARIPDDMVPHVLEVMRERDAETKRLCPEGNPAAGVKNAALAIAIQTVRERHKDENNGQAAAN